MIPRQSQNRAQKQGLQPPFFIWVIKLETDEPGFPTPQGGRHMDSASQAQSVSLTMRLAVTSQRIRRPPKVIRQKEFRLRSSYRTGSTDAFRMNKRLPDHHSGSIANLMRTWPIPRHRRRHRCHWRHATGLAQRAGITSISACRRWPRRPPAGRLWSGALRRHVRQDAALGLSLDHGGGDPDLHDRPDATAQRADRLAHTGSTQLRAVTAGAAADAARRTTVCDTGGGAAGAAVRSRPDLSAACSARPGCSVAARNRLTARSTASIRAAPMHCLCRPRAACEIIGAGAMGKKFIYGCWPTLANVSHHHGTDPEGQATLQRFAPVSALRDAHRHRHWIIVTADHGSSIRRVASRCSTPTTRRSPPLPTVAVAGRLGLYPGQRADSNAASPRVSATAPSSSAPAGWSGTVDSAPAPRALSSHRASATTRW